MYGICRVDGKSGHYWWVRLNYVGSKPTIQKCFRGDKEQALKEAIAFRDFHAIKPPREKYIENSKYEQWHTPKELKDKWKEERLEKRLNFYKQTGQKVVHVGTGIEAAKKARAMGASKVTCWKIKTGKSDSYQIYNQLKGENIEWKDRPTGKKRDIEIQKQIGKKRIVLGTGIEAALEAKKLGASQGKCLNILNKKQSFFNSCWTLPHYEVNGFQQELTEDIIEKINNTVSRYVKEDFQMDVTTEVMLNFASRTEIDNIDDFIRALVFKYNQIIRLENNGRYMANKKWDTYDFERARYDEMTERIEF